MAPEAAEKVRHIQIIVPADMYRDFKKICVEEDTNMRAKLLELISGAVAADAGAKKNFFTMSSEERTAMYAEATQAEVALHHAAGRYTTHGDEKGVYRLYPDGRKQYVSHPDRDKKRG